MINEDDSERLHKRIQTIECEIEGLHREMAELTSVIRNLDQNGFLRVQKAEAKTQ